jgi:uncharacterized repeat protein (TIGR03803 family)
MNKVAKIITLLVGLSGLNSLTAQISLLGTSANSTSTGHPWTAFGSVYSIGADSTDFINRKYDLKGYAGANPAYMDLCPATDGKLYGYSSNGYVIFSYEPVSETYQIETTFPSYFQNPLFSFCDGRNGKLYGVTRYGGAHSWGVLYEYDFTFKTFVVLHDFETQPSGAPLVASNGIIYGACADRMYQYDPSTHSFDNGSRFAYTGTSTGSLLEASDGKIYGLTAGYGFSPISNIFVYDPVSQTSSIAYTFPRKTVFSYTSGLMEASNGKLYGLVTIGPIPYNLGSVFEFDPSSGTSSFVYDFSSSTGSEPQGKLIQASNGKLYGTTTRGAAAGNGDIFEYDISTSTYTKLTDFSNTHIDFQGGGPRGGFVLGPNGKCYCTTWRLGLSYKGEIVEFDPLTNIKTTKINFSHSFEGEMPIHGITKSSSGKFYGVTVSGGLSNEGTIFEYEPVSNTYTQKLDFSNNNMRSPLTKLVEMPDGTFYGTCAYDSLSAIGIYSIYAIFQWDPLTGIATKRFTFIGAFNGLEPQWDLLLANDGKLYAGAIKYPASGPSTIVLYSYDPLANTCSLLYDYGTPSNNMRPAGRLVQASNGKIYGTIAPNGASGNGRLFEYDIAGGALTDKYIFDGTVLGKTPGGGLIETSPGVFYGLVTSGIISGPANGQLYEFNSAGSTVVMKKQFVREVHGLYPAGDLLRASNGKLYGGTNVGKTTLNGSIFEYDMTTDSLRSILEMHAEYGMTTPAYLTEYNAIFPPLVSDNNTTISKCVLSDDSVHVNVAGTGPYAYAWQENTGSGWINIIPSVYYSGAGTGTLHIDSMTASMDSVQFRCIVNSPYGSDTSGITTFLIRVLPVPSISSAVATVCPGHPAIIHSLNDSSVYYQWLYNGTVITSASDSTYAANNTGTFSVQVSNSLGCRDTSSAITLSRLCDVWPGDANNDYVVDNADLLPIGLFYGDYGHPRSVISNAWQGWPSTDWFITQSNGSDIKHIDCNGDSLINANDTLAIGLNFSSAHAIASHLPASRTSDPFLYFTSASNTYAPGDWVDIDVMAGSAALPVSFLYGLSFNIGYDPSLVQAGSESISYPPSWLGDPSIDAIKFSRIETAVNTAFGAITRTDKSNRNGFGKIATFRFRTSSGITSLNNMNLSLNSYRANNSYGATLAFNDSIYTIMIDPLSTEITEENSIGSLSIFPNPYSGSTTIHYKLDKRSVVSVEMYNTMGQNIHTLTSQTQSAGSYSYNFSAKALGMDAGIYFVKITVDGKTTMKRIVEM